MSRSLGREIGTPDFVGRRSLSERCLNRLETGNKLRHLIDMSRLLGREKHVPDLNYQEKQTSPSHSFPVKLNFSGCR